MKVSEAVLQFISTWVWAVSCTGYKQIKLALFTLSDLISSIQLWEVSVIKGDMAQACDY